MERDHDNSKKYTILGNESKISHMDEITELITDISDISIHTYADNGHEEYMDSSTETMPIDISHETDASTSCMVGMAYETLFHEWNTSTMYDGYENYNFACSDTNILEIDQEYTYTTDNTNMSDKVTSHSNEIHTNEVKLSESSTGDDASAISHPSAIRHSPNSQQQAHASGTQNINLVMENLNNEDYISILTELQSSTINDERRNWNTMSLSEFMKVCESKSSMDKCFQKKEVYLMAKVIERMPKFAGLTIKSNFPKYKILNVLFEDPVILKEDNPLEAVDNSKKTQKQSRSRRKKIECLKNIAWAVVKQFKKEHLAVVIAEKEWSGIYIEWQAKSPLPAIVQIEGLSDGLIEWFSRPSTDIDGKVRFHFTDACHLLTCLRTKVCTTGIQGLDKKAWEKAALSKDTNLNISVVVDCVDKQDVALARRVFDEDVERVMIRNNHSAEATFCSLIRRWFDAEDEPSISAIERCRQRIELRKWLLEEFPIGKFPPPTRYVHGVPIVTYEALLTHTERKIQLYAFVPESKYNVRATGTQEVEQLFSTFRDLDPAGIGTPKPDAIPEMLATAVELDNFRMDPEKPFYMKTSKAEIYPTDMALSSPDDGDNGVFRMGTESVKSMTKIHVEDHFFDTTARSLRKHKRRSGTVTKPNLPSHGEKGVRQYHARDDSKIPAHRRLGLLNLPDC